jgi:hypothetical protein
MSDVDYGVIFFEFYALDRSLGAGRVRSNCFFKAFQQGCDGLLLEITSDDPFKLS